MYLVEVTGMSREAKGNAGHTVYKISDQSRVMRKMSVQMVYPFSGLTLPCQEQVDLVNSQ